jgi:hypothetical protein
MLTSVGDVARQSKYLARLALIFAAWKEQMSTGKIPEGLILMQMEFVLRPT